jgi:UDP-glucose 4-epimerase
VGYGHVKSDKGVANTFFYDALIKKRVTIHGDGKQFRPFVSLQYLVSCLAKSVEDEISSGIHNLSQANLQVLDLLDEVKKVLPETEFIFTNHHLHLPSLLVSSNHSDFFAKQPLDMAHEYGEFLKQAKI